MPIINLLRTSIVDLHMRYEAIHQREVKRRMLQAVIVRGGCQTPIRGDNGHFAGCADSGGKNQALYKHDLTKVAGVVTALHATLADRAGNKAEAADHMSRLAGNKANTATLEANKSLVSDYLSKLGYAIDLAQRQGDSGAVARMQTERAALRLWYQTEAVPRVGD